MAENNSAISTNTDNTAQLQEAQKKTKSIIELNREKREQERAGRIAANQPNVNEYFRRLNGNITRDDIGSIVGGVVSKKDYQTYIDNAKQYASTQPKQNLTDLAAFQQAIWDRQEARNELDKLNEQRRVQRETLGRGIGEISVMLGDIAKAQGGAIVTPRSIDQQIQQLGERERNAYKLYNANQQRIGEDRLKAMQDEQERQDLADWRKQQKQDKLDLEDKKHQDKLAEIEARKKPAQEIAVKLGNTALNIAGVAYQFKKGLDSALLGTARALIQEEAKNNDAMKEDIALVIRQYQSKYDAVQSEAMAINYFLSTYWNEMSPETRLKFLDIAKSASSITPLSNFDVNQEKPKIKNANSRRGKIVEKKDNTQQTSTGGLY